MSTTRLKRSQDRPKETEMNFWKRYNTFWSLRTGIGCLQSLNYTVVTDVFS